MHDAFELTLLEEVVQVEVEGLLMLGVEVALDLDHGPQHINVDVVRVLPFNIIEVFYGLIAAVPFHPVEALVGDLNFLREILVGDILRLGVTFGQCRAGLHSFVELSVLETEQFCLNL